MVIKHKKIINIVCLNFCDAVEEIKKYNLGTYIEFFNSDVYGQLTNVLEKQKILKYLFLLVSVS